MAEGNPQAAPGGQDTAPKTEQSFLTPEERSAMQRMLSFPEEFPRKLGSWISEFIAVNGLEIPASQIRGIQAFRPLINVLSANVPTGSTTYVDGGGPELVDLASGTYLFLYGFQFGQNTGNNEGYALASPSINGAAAADGNAVRTRFLLGSDDATSDADKTNGSAIFFKTHTFTEPTNTIRMKYRVTDGSISFTNIYIIAIKLSN